MTLKFDNLYKDTVGNTYDTSDPIVIFINNLKKLNSNADMSGALANNNNNNNNEPSNRNRKKTFNSNDSSDFDSSNQSSLLSSSDLDEDDDDDYEEEAPTSSSSSAARSKPQSGANAQKRQPTSSNKYKKLKRN
jgi:hypothetical protein